MLRRRMLRRKADPKTGNREAHFVRTCAVEMPQEAFCAEIYRENAGR